MDGGRSVVLENEVELLHWPTEGSSDKTGNGRAAANGSGLEVREEEALPRDSSRLFSSVSCEDDLQIVLAIAESCGIGLANRMLDRGAGKILEEAKVENAKAN